MICENYPPDGGGIATSAWRLAHSLASEVEVHVVRFPPGAPVLSLQHTVVREAPALAVHEIRPFVNGWSRPPSSPEKARILCRASRHLAEVLGAEGIDLVHGFGLQNAGLVAACASRLLRLPLVQSLRGNDIGRNAFDGLRREPLARALATARIIVPVNRWLARLAEAHFPGLGERIQVIPNGVDAESLARAPEASESPSADWATPVVGFLGKLREKKGPHVIAEIVRRFLGPRGGTLLVLGEVDLALFHEAGWRGGDLRAGRVVVAPLQDRRAAGRLIRACDFLVFPSLDDGMANGLLEAMACGRPVICSPLFDDVVRDGIEGRLVSPLDPDAWIAACEALWQDPEGRKALGIAAQERVRRNFSPAAERAAWLALYATALKAGTWSNASAFR